MTQDDALSDGRTRIGPAIALLFIAPTVGELVSGHLAPVEFFNPITFVAMALPYGCGALLCREFARRWHTGWPALVLLAMAFAIYEEGIVSRALFDPAWHEEPQLAGLDNAFGVNWSLSAMLIHFHVTISIFASVTIAELLYRERRRDRWLGNRYAMLCAGVLAAWAPALAWLARNDHPLYVPAPHVWVIAALAICGCIAAARIVSARDGLRAAKHVPSPLTFLAFGCVNMSVMVGVVLVLPENGMRVPLSVLMPALVGFDTFALWLLLRWSSYGTRWDDRHRLALVAGFLSPFLALGILGDFEHFTGRSLVGVAAIVVLYRLQSRVRAQLNAPKLQSL